ncbi:glycine--tRNA ligase [Myceligenerans halotolerans]
MLSLQDVLLRLTAYWTERGAMIVQPFNTEVGAGTANPATTLRVLGPEPWRVAYVEPSVRPDDSRYGQNPNRLQTHTQFQVILKPDPGDPQEVYLASLEAIGVDLAAHDIRFVEDNWASPALGAWGLGWEVWLDGLEITQFTYFQQAGTLKLDPVSVEITYGIERIVMALQGVSHFADIDYAPGITYGEAFGQSEYEMSRYYLDEADIVTTQRLYDLHAEEAQKMLDAGLAMPAYYNVLKCSHAFNVLDARGAVSTAERARAFALMRNLSKGVAELFVARRSELGFPLGTATPKAPPAPLAMPDVTGPARLLFEIGVEELPAAEVTRARDWLESTISERLASTKLSHGQVHAYATPRRLVMLVEDVAPREADSVETIRGPRTSAAFDDSGAPTRAATGFAAKHGIDPAQLDRIEQDGSEYVAVVRNVEGRPAPEVLSSLLAQVVVDLRAERNMRWNDPALSYARPVRWLLAMLGGTAIPVTASELTSGTTTRVQRVAAEPVVQVPSADGYLEFLREHDIVADAQARRSTILDAAQEHAAKVSGRVDLEADASVVAEIVNLVESPVPILGAFDERYLDLPPEILTSVMRKHQRYLPLRTTDGLLPHFLTFANGACDVATVTRGNEAVVRARFEDALFFWEADQKVPLQTMKDGLAKLAFEETLGSMADRAGRIAVVAKALGERLGLDDAERTTLHRAADLAKFDLGSQMVIEMTSLAGTMARYYATNAGEGPAVADALADMERPRTSDDAVASSTAGAILAIADRADLLVGLFAVGANPTGSSDPFALRRAALGLLATIRAHSLFDAVTTGGIFQIAATTIDDQGVAVSESALTATEAFVRARFEQSLLDTESSPDAVAAVLPLANEPRRADATLADIEHLAGEDRFASLVEAVQRIRRLIKDADPDGNPALLTAAVEQQLATAVKALQGTLDSRSITLPQLISASSETLGVLDTFLEEVLVMDEDAEVRDARIALLASVTHIAGRTGIDWEAASRLVATGRKPASVTG